MRTRSRLRLSLIYDQLHPLFPTLIIINFVNPTKAPGAIGYREIVGGEWGRRGGARPVSNSATTNDVVARLFSELRQPYHGHSRVHGRRNKALQRRNHLCGSSQFPVCALCITCLIWPIPSSNYMNNQSSGSLASCEHAVLPVFVKSAFHARRLRPEANVSCFDSTPKPHSQFGERGACAPAGNRTRETGMASEHFLGSYARYLNKFSIITLSQASSKM